MTSVLDVPEDTVMRKTITIEQRKQLAKKLAKMTPEQRAKLSKLSMPRMVDEYMAHIPHPKQQVYLGLQTYEAMFGGSAGGGKSDALLMAALQYVDVPGYSALIVRRTWVDLNAPGAILDRANTWFAGTSARKRDGGRSWEFPTFDQNGNPANPARITFGYLQYDGDKFKHQGAEYQFVGFDELTQFEESTYTYLFSRIRKPALACTNCQKPVRQYNSSAYEHSSRSSKCKGVRPDPKVLAQYPASKDNTSIFDVPLRMRSATNPGGRGHEWVRDRFVNLKTMEPDAVFVPSALADNPSLDYEEYVKGLMHLSPIDRQRLLEGDWDVVEQGQMFERHWFKMLRTKVAPVSRNVVRFWDNAASANKGDWTVGTKMILTDEGLWVVEDVVRGQWSSHEKAQVIRSTAASDGVRCAIRMEQEPGSAGVDVIDNMRRNVLQGYNFDGIRSSGDKETRAAPLASSTEAGNVYLMEGAWNKAFLDEFSTFPLGNHDDIVDATAGALSFLAFQPRARLLV